MKICRMAIACLVIGLLAPMVYAVEKPQRGERRSPDIKKAGMPTREPADTASKMLSEFDSNGDDMLNLQELTAMLGGMRERLQQARSGNSRAGRSRLGLSRPGQGSPMNVQRGLGVSGARKQSPKGTGSEAKSAGASAEKPNKLPARPPVRASKRRGRVPGVDQEQNARPGGVRPEPNAAQ